MSFFSKLKAKWELGCFTTNYDEGIIPNFVAECLIDEDWIDFDESDNYVAVVKTSTGKVIEFWQENKYYAFFSRGSMTLNGKSVSWNSEMPSVEKMLAIVKKKEKFQNEMLLDFK